LSRRQFSADERRFQVFADMPDAAFASWREIAIFSISDCHFRRNTFSPIRRFSSRLFGCHADSASLPLPYAITLIGFAAIASFELKMLPRHAAAASRAARPIILRQTCRH